MNDVVLRVDAMERTLPQRCHTIEHRQVVFVETLNAMTAAINTKIEQVEQLVLSRLTVEQLTQPPQTSAPPVPPIPQSYGGPRASTPGAQHFNVGSPLSAPPGFVQENLGAPLDPWAQWAGSAPSVTACLSGQAQAYPVSYTHLTLPTILLV